MKNENSGFSLVEVLIVIVIAMIIVAIAVPTLLASRRAANEGSAISTMRTLNGAQSTYQATTGAGNYAGTESITGDTAGLTVLANLRMIDPVLAAGSKSGYHVVGAIHNFGAGDPATFFFTANPASASGVTQSGSRRFCVTQAGYIGADSSNLAVEFDALTAPLAPPLDH